MRVAVIGAGLGGLSVSCLLAKQGHRVTLYEKNDRPGGKIAEYKKMGYRFDTGPSLLTMPFILRELFDRCESNIADYLTFAPVDPITRYFYPDGTRFDCYQQSEKNISQIEKFARKDVESWHAFSEYSEKLYRRSRNAFLFNPLYGIEDFASLKLTDFLRINAFSTVAHRVDDYFESPYLRKFFKRFTTYNGSSPYQAPATLNVIPHVELAMGGYYVEGGMYRLTEALSRLARSLGVEMHYGHEVREIGLEVKKVIGIINRHGNLYKADIVVSNADAAETYTRLLPADVLPARKKKKIEELEPSSSGLVILLGIDRNYEQLSHHNIFFSSDYRAEFDQIFNRKRMPDDPTIYIANTSATDPGDAPDGGSNLFILVNAPYVNESWNWDTEEKAYSEFILSELERRGLDGLRKHIKVKKNITPIDFQKRYRSNRGSIYGTSSNSRMAAFMRPRNKSRDIDGLYLTGGSTHPGGGIPLVILSSFHAFELINRFEKMKF